MRHGAMAVPYGGHTGQARNGDVPPTSRARAAAAPVDVRATSPRQKVCPQASAWWQGAPRPRPGGLRASVDGQLEGLALVGVFVHTLGLVPVADAPPDPAVDGALVGGVD